MKWLKAKLAERRAMQVLYGTREEAARQLYMKPDPAATGFLFFPRFTWGEIARSHRIKELVAQYLQQRL